MLDTIKLTLDKNSFEILDLNAFQRHKVHGGTGYFTFIQNGTKNGGYVPRLRLGVHYNCSKRYEWTLTIELSLPKLMFGNNFDELADGDFSLVHQKLHQALLNMSIRVPTEVLKNAPVSAVHYSKNIPLTDGTTPHYLISKIKEANTKISLDTNQTDYRNEGCSYKMHTNSYEVAFYDKIKDLETAQKSPKRALEMDSGEQLELFKSLQKRQKFEVLRFEVRLNTRQKIKHLFKSIDVQLDPTFKNVFSSVLSQKVLIHYLDDVTLLRLPLLDYKAENPKSLLAGLIISNPNLGLKRIIQVYGLKQILDAISPRELRPMFGRYSNRSWYRLIADTKNINLPPTIDPLEVIREHLVTYQPMKLVQYQQARNAMTTL
jgi:hypothetical protein